MRPLVVVEARQASLCEALAYMTSFLKAQSLGRADDIFFQLAPIGAKVALTSAPALRDIGRLPARHFARLAVTEANKDPNYVVPMSAPTKEARSAAGAEQWKKLPPKKKEKEVGSCVEIKIRAPHAIDATLSP